MDNNINEYRNIRYQRTYRTIGKMSWWRIVLGVVLIVYVLLLSGLVSQMLAARMQFQLAEKLMISPEWMEKYKPETKAFIEAGVLYENGDFMAATEAFGEITGVDAAVSMKSASALRLAAQRNEEKDFIKACELLMSVDFELLSDDDRLEYTALCDALLENFNNSTDAKADEYASALSEIIAKNS